MNYGNGRGGAATQNRNNGDADYQVIPESELEWRAPSSEPHPTGLHRLALIKVEPFFDQDTGEKKAKMIFHSDEELENGDPWPVSCKTKASFHPRSNAGKFLAARGEDLKSLSPNGFKLSDYEKGKSKFGYVMGNVIHEPLQDGSGVYARIESFAPMPKKRKRDEEAFVEEEPTPAAPPADDRAEKRRRALSEDDDD